MISSIVLLLTLIGHNSAFKLYRLTMNQMDIEYYHTYYTTVTC